MHEAELMRVPQIARAGYESTLAERLEQIWKTEPGISGWLATVDHKKIGIRYIVTALIFLLVGGVEALVMRVQLGGPEQHLLTPRNTTSSSRCTALR